MQDEYHFQQHGSRCRMWIPPESRRDPIVMHAPRKKSVACFGAANLSTGRLVLVLDNAAYHHARLLQPLLRKHRPHLSLFLLPPYSPQLSTIERVWKLARRLATHNRHFPTLPAVLEAWRRSRPASVVGSGQ
jgi:DDE superfamily endonuclease